SRYLRRRQRDRARPRLCPDDPDRSRCAAFRSMVPRLPRRLRGFSTPMTVPAILSNLRLPVIGAPLFIVSCPALVIAQCKAGIVGSFPALNARPASMLDEWLHRITEELAAWDRDHPEAPSAPFAVNHIVHKSSDRLEHDVEATTKWKVPIIITSLGAQTPVNDAVHSYGGTVLHDVINDRFARKAIEKGADGLIPV